MAWGVKEIEGAVAEIVVCSEWLNLESILLSERDLLEFPSCEIDFSHIGLRVLWICGQFFFLETWADNELCGRGKSARVSNMVPV